MASIDDDKIVSLSLSTYISYHQTEAIWSFRFFFSPLTAMTTRVAFEISRLLFSSSYSFFIFCFCLTAQAVIPRCILVIIFYDWVGFLKKVSTKMKIIECLNLFYLILSSSKYCNFQHNYDFLKINNRIV